MRRRGVEIILEMLEGDCQRHQPAGALPPPVRVCGRKVLLCAFLKGATHSLCHLTIKHELPWSPNYGEQCFKRGNHIRPTGNGSLWTTNCEELCNRGGCPEVYEKISVGNEWSKTAFSKVSMRLLRRRVVREEPFGDVCQSVGGDITTFARGQSFWKTYIRSFWVFENVRDKCLDI